MEHSEKYGPWAQRNLQSPYHFILDLASWKLILGSFVLWTLVNLIFGGIYYIDIDNLGGNHTRTYGDAFFFSVQTMSTIGYGNLPPQSTYLNTVVFIEAWIALIVDALIVALTVGKISRPTRLRHTILFSQVAIIGDLASVYEPPEGLNQAQPGMLTRVASCLRPGGEYKKGCMALTFRLVNLRKRQLASPLFQLYLLKKELDGEYVVHELDFEVNRQTGRSRTLAFSLPFLPLPWTIVHKIDHTSPLFHMQPQDMINSEYEIVAIFDAVDELSSHNFQARWSYLPKEIKWNCRFEPMVRRSKEGFLEVDYTKISDIRGDRFSIDALHNNDGDILALLNPSKKGPLMEEEGLYEF